MVTVDNISNTVLMLIRAGIIFRVLYLFIQIIMNPDQIEHSKKHIKNTIIALIFAEGIFLIKDLVNLYYG